MEQEQTDSERGLYRKYAVQRVDDPDGKHTDCPYFVLDIKHDIHARRALLAYIVDCGEKFPQLAADLMKLLNTTPLEHT